VKREKGRCPPGARTRAGFKSILFDPEGSVLFMEIRGTRAEEQEPHRPFSRLPVLSP